MAGGENWKRAQTGVMDGDFMCSRDSSHMKIKLFVAASAVTLVSVISLLHLPTRVLKPSPNLFVPRETHETYSTTFPHPEDPVSENGKWMNGRAVGLDWADIRTIPGLAYGTESGSKKYDDSTALLTGTWGPNQSAQATVYTVNQTDNIHEEVELRLRSSLSRHHATGYEINFRCSKTKAAYSQIVRWNGPLGSFTYLANRVGSAYGVSDGDVVKATIIRNVIKAYINGVQVLQAADDTYNSGSPGMGFYLDGTTDVAVNYGFTTFTAMDGPNADARVFDVSTKHPASSLLGPAWPATLMKSVRPLHATGVQTRLPTVPAFSPTNLLPTFL